MNQFVLSQQKDPELRLFPHILEIGVLKNTAIRLNGFAKTCCSGVRIYYIQEGKFEWFINELPFTLFPGDLLFISPNVVLSSSNDVMEIGSFSWIQIDTEMSDHHNPGKHSWTALSKKERDEMKGILFSNIASLIQKFTEAGTIFKCIQKEIFDQQIGYQTRINHLIDEMFILITRNLTCISNSVRDFPSIFMNLEQEIRRDLARQWTVEEMASFVGLGTTLFNEKVKSYSGFSPLAYLINIRISEAIKLLKQPDINLTDIALDTGFYSSQHFSTTFKKLTGYTPSEFRKNHL